MYSEIIGDIETLDTKNSAVVVSIGLVKFNLDEDDNYDTLEDEERSFYAVLDLDEQINTHGRTASAGTVTFWIGQDKQAQHVFKEKREAVEVVLKAITKWVGRNNSNLWGNGNVFDNVILRSLYADYDLPFPFRYWEDLDLRTLKYLSGSPKLNIPKGVAHNALDDAKYEVLCAQEYFRGLRQ